MNEKSKVRGFLAQHFVNRQLQDSDDIFASGFVNSLFAMQIILFIEKEFKITIESKDLELANFRTVEAISALVERKRNASQTVA